MAKASIKLIKPRVTDEIPFYKKHLFHLIVFLFALLMFSNSLFNDYNMDDELVTLNHRLTSKGISAIPEIITSPYYQDNQGYAYEYRPIVLITFAIEHSLFGEKATISHFVNVFLYALCCLLLFKTLLLVFRNLSPVINFSIILLFASHSSHTEVVSSIKNRDEILALIFVLLSCISAAQAVNNTKKWCWGIVPIWFSLALLSKTTIMSFAILIPFTLLLFTAVSLAEYIFCVISLSIPLFFFLNFTSGYDRIKTVLGILLLNILLYGLKNLKIADSLRQKASLLFSHSDADFLTNLTVSTTGFKYIKKIFQDAIPSRTIFIPSTVIFLTLTFGICYLILISYDLSILGLIPLIALIILGLFGNSKTKWWATVTIDLCLVMNVRYVNLHEDNIAFQYIVFTGIYLAYGIIFGKIEFLYPRLFFFSLSIIFSGVHAFESLSLVIIIYVIRYKWMRLGFMLLLIFYSVNDLVSLGRVDDWSRAVLMLIIVVVHFKKGSKEISWGIAFFALFFFHAMRFHYDKNIGGEISQLSITIPELANQFNPQIIKKQDRPLQYTEVCIQQNDPFTLRFGTSMEILFHYLKKTILPYPLAYYYGYKFIKPMNITDAIPMISLVIHLAIFAVALYLMNKDPLISFGLFTYLFSIAVFSNYVQYVPGMVADRYLLVPSLGWSIILVGVIRKFSGIADNAKDINWKSIKPIAKYSFLSILLLYSVLTFSRNTYWKDDLTLFRHDIEYVNESAQAHNLLALHLMIHSTKESTIEKQNALAQEALIHFKKAQEIYPPFFNVAYDIGRVSSMLNMPDSAIRSFEYALTLDSTLPDIYMRLGDLYFVKNDIARANIYLAHYIQLTPNEYTGYSKLSYNYYLLKQYDQSVKTNLGAISKIPGLAAPYINIAQIFLETNQRDSARIYLFKARELSPNDAGLANKINQLGF